MLVEQNNLSQKLDAASIERHAEMDDIHVINQFSEMLLTPVFNSPITMENKITSTTNSM